MNRKIILLLAWGMLISSLTWIHITPHTVAAHAYVRDVHIQSVSLVGPPTSNVAVFNSGSTNSCPWTLYVNTKNAITFSSCHFFISNQKLFPALLATFLRDVKEVLPVSTLPQNHGCFKSVSFGTATIVVYNTAKSPDLSCSIDTVGKQIYQDILAIQRAIENRESLAANPTSNLPLYTPTPVYSFAPTDTCTRHVRARTSACEVNQ